MFGPDTDVKEIQIRPVHEGTLIPQFGKTPLLHNEDICAEKLFSFHLTEFIMDCNFDQGACEWVQDKTDNIDWSVAYHNDGKIIVITSVTKPFGIFLADLTKSV